MKFQKILLTGGSRGIGRALLNIFLEDGSEVHVISRKFDDNQSDPNLIFHSLDLTNTGRVNEFAENFIESYGIPDLLINNASYFKYDDVLDINNKIWDKAIETNLKAPIDLSTYYYKSIKKKGCIINIIDNKILNPNPDFFSYTVSKFGLEGATKLLAMRFAPKIRVFGIAPGITLQSGDQTIQNFKKVHNNNPLNSGATPEEIADTCVFLEKIQSMTGFTIPIDGGHSMYNYGKDIQYT